MRSVTLITLILSIAGVTNAALTISGTNILTDGTMEYLTVHEFGAVKYADLQTILAGEVAGHDDWRLGTRVEFFEMVKNHLSRDFSSYLWGDLFLSDGTVYWMDADVYANLDNPNVKLFRSGNDVGLAQEFKNLILMMGGNNADPAFTLWGMATADLDGNGYRYQSGLQAYYKSDTGTTIGLNNTLSGPDAQGKQSLADETILSSKWFVVREVPEPATLGLLGVGALLIRRKK